MTTLAAAASAVGLNFGFALSSANKAAYPDVAAIAVAESNIFVDENGQMFGSLQPTQGNYTWTAADALVAWSGSNGMTVVQGGHLVWDQYLPSWVTSITNATTLRSVMESHITTTIAHYGQTVQHWNVLNEAIKASDGNPGNFRTGHWYNILGVDYAKWAFLAAEAVCPVGVKLIYNCGGPNPEETAFVESLLSAGCRVDGVGFQMHVWETSATSAYHVTQMNNMAALGVDIYITELDVKDNSFLIATRDADCAAQFTYSMGTVFRDVPSLKHVVCWSPSDLTSWINMAYPRGDGNPTGGGNCYNRSTPPGANPLRQAIIDAFALRDPVFDTTGNVANALTNDRATITVATPTTAIEVRLGTDVLVDHNGLALTSPGRLTDETSATLDDESTLPLLDGDVNALTGQTTTGSESVTLTLTGGT